MKRRFFVGLVAATAVTASLFGVSAASAATPPATPDATAAGAQSASVTPIPSNLDPIKVDPGQFKIVATLRGVGKQVYDCNTAGTGYTFREPIAGLFTSQGIPAAIHGKGPFWANFDGSRVDGSTSVAPVSVPSPDPAKNVPWLKVTGVPVPHTTGVFSNVAFIQRIDTRGGVTPTGACTVPKTVAVDYTANYVFWAPK